MLNLGRFVCFLRSRVRRIVDDESGVSAIEFAMILPLMVTLYLGAVELSEGIAIDRKVTLAARSVTDLVSQSNTALSSSDMDNLLQAGSVVMEPYLASSGSTKFLRIVVSQIKTDAQGNATVDWSAGWPSGGTPPDPTPLTRGNSFTGLPEAFKSKDSNGNYVTGYIILGQVSYFFRPSFIGQFLKNGITLRDQMYMRVRQSACVTYTPQEAAC